VTLAALLAFGLAAAVVPPPPDIAYTAEQALRRYRDMTGSAGPSSAGRRCVAQDNKAGEIVVCAKDQTRERLPFPDAHTRMPAGEVIRHPDEVPRADGRVDLAPCGITCPGASHVRETNRRIWSWLKGQDPD
jgi:hypothetical protein